MVLKSLATRCQGERGQLPSEGATEQLGALECVLGPWSGIYETLTLCWGFPGGASGKDSTCQCRRHKRHRFNPWVGKIPWRRHGNPL